MKLGLVVKQLINRFGYDVRYHRPLYDIIIKPLGIQTILDIGANDGHYSKEASRLFPNAAIIAFEPLSDCFQRLLEVSKVHPNITPLQIGLGAESGSFEIEKSSFHPSSSLLPMSALHKTLYPKSAVTKKESITIARLDDIAKTVEMRVPLMAKIDVQGYEGKVIEGGADTLKKASVIQIETSFFPLYEGQPLFNDIAEQLGRLGFLYYGALQTHYSKKTNRPMYEDSLFISRDIAERFEQEEV